MRSAAPVCLLGQTVVNNLFREDEDPVGAMIRVKSFPLRVVGVLAVKGQSNFGQDQDDVVLMPVLYRRAQGDRHLTGHRDCGVEHGADRPIRC